MTRQVRLCIVGCGVIVDSHLLAIAAASPAQFIITALVDPDAAARSTVARRIQHDLGTPPPVEFGSLAEALAADPDSTLFEAVDLLVPSIGTLHEDISCEAMSAGRHTLLEKPIAVSMGSAERIVAAGAVLMAIHSKVLMVAENSRKPTSTPSRQVDPRGDMSEQVQSWSERLPVFTEYISEIIAAQKLIQEGAM